MTGTATFTPRGAERFDYLEHGQFHLLDGRTLDAQRRYIFAERDGGFAVLFAEDPPRLFHNVALARSGPNLVGSATHRCADDSYDSRYEFRDDGSFIVEHRVRGPRKRYVMLTRYSRD